VSEEAAGEGSSLMGGPNGVSDHSFYKRRGGKHMVRIVKGSYDLTTLRRFKRYIISLRALDSLKP